MEKMSFFESPICDQSKYLDPLISICQYDVFKVSSKKNELKGSVRGVKVDFFFRGGIEWARLQEICWFSSSKYHLSHVDDTLSSPHHSIDMIT